jgi:hypothetical protein
VVRSLGRAWVEPDGEGGCRMRRGLVDDGCLTEAQAHERMLARQAVDAARVRSELTEPGIPHLRGPGHTPGWIMGALGDRPAREVTTREINLLLRKIAATGVSPRTVNKARQLIDAVFNYGMRPQTWGLTENPAKWADRRREPEPGSSPLLQRRTGRGPGARLRVGSPS